MAFDNSNKRDVLIMVNFPNVGKIKEIQKKYYDIADKIDPHIAVTFPFDSEISDEELYNKLVDVLSNHGKWVKENPNVPSSRAARFRIFSPSAMTSGPMPSPAMTAILCFFMVLFIPLEASPSARAWADATCASRPGQTSGFWGTSSCCRTPSRRRAGRCSRRVPPT